MFEDLQMAPPDAILGINEAFRGDSNPEKINLSVGVYKDADGNTPILECVREAERRLLAEEKQKAYLGMEGLPAFGERARNLLFGDQPPPHAVSLQTPGGTGALRVAADFVHQRFPSAAIWCSKPTWANHPKVFEAAGLTVKSYGYSDAAGKGLDFDAMCRDLHTVPAGDIVCLHACCHNPSGIDPSDEQWQEIAKIVSSRKLLPLVDFAYQGFGSGLEQDAAGLRLLLAKCDEALICSSYSKNFGLYAERIGALTAVAASADAAQAALSHLKLSVRTNYSNPPKHGGAIVATILADEQLTHQWQGELAQMRDRINGMRTLFVESMQAKGVDRDFSFITGQRGMFSFSGLTPVQVDQLRSEYSIYVVGSGRINVAGMTEHNMDRLCTAIAAVL